MNATTSNPFECATPLDEQLRELALTDWCSFVKLIGPEIIGRAKICLLRKDKKSLRFIAKKLKTTKGRVENSCKRCPDL